MYSMCTVMLTSKFSAFLSIGDMPCSEKAPPSFVLCLRTVSFRPPVSDMHAPRDNHLEPGGPIHSSLSMDPFDRSLFSFGL